MKRLRGKLTYSNVMVTVLAFVVFAGGTAYAASEMLPKNSVGTKQLAKEAVTPANLSKASKATLTGPAGAKGATGATGPQGPKGEAGVRGEEGMKGEVGPPATKLWAVVSATPEVIRAMNVSSLSSPAAGRVDVIFDQDVSQCNFQATMGNPGSGNPPKGFISVALDVGDPHGVFVETLNTSAALTAEPFHLAVFC